MATKEIIKKSIECAGGVEVVAAQFKIGDRAVRKWWQVQKIPTDHIFPLCQMGGFKVKPDQLNPTAFPAELPQTIPANEKN